MSLGGGGQILNYVVKALTRRGIHVCVAAGNEGSDACKVSPASERTAITVGATEDKSDRVIDFSNFGKCLDIFAPGRNIKSADFLTNDGFQIFSGTSQATPHVAGTVALIIGQFGNSKTRQNGKDLNMFCYKRCYSKKHFKR